MKDCLLRILAALLSAELTACQPPTAQRQHAGLSKPAKGADAFERDVDNLTADTPSERSRASLHAIEAAGAAAFPSLVAHLEDVRKAQPSFLEQDVVDVWPSGETRVHEPTIGEVCFALIQGQVEGNWPKDFRHYYALTPKNVRDWLAARREMTLDQLREAAKAESLRHVDADLKARPADERLLGIRRFILKPFDRR